jgi:hypothetical protein
MVGKREMVIIEWDNGSKEFAVLEKDPDTRTYDKIVDSLGYVAMKRSKDIAKKRFIDKGVLT